ncbi:hypothetical protein FOA52_015537 [Chlamydomonas sp. UWO 241]|nr:hypothetical protein FOA52_015537 [Chlamydomonas sp. UWO 241]
MGLQQLLLAVVAASVIAGALGRSVTTFPYQQCDDRHRGLITVANYTVTGQELSFTLYTDSPSPLQGECAQDINKIEINTHWSCRYSKVTAYANGVKLNTPSFDGAQIQDVPGAQILKMYVDGISWAGVAASPLTITLVLGSQPGYRKCNVFQRYFPADPEADPLKPWHLLNSTAAEKGSPIDVAVFSSDMKCCVTPPTTTPDALPPMPPTPPAACQACSTLTVEYTGNLAPTLGEQCFTLAQLMNKSPVLNTLAAPGALSMVRVDWWFVFSFVT